MKTKFNAEFNCYNNYSQVNILVAGGCSFWCHKQDGKITPSLKSAELYDVELDKWDKAADLPVPLQSASMELLGGKPTIIGGFDSDSLDWNPILYQYDAELGGLGKWKPLSNVRMRMPRSSAAVFQVPRDLFYC